MLTLKNAEIGNENYKKALEKVLKEFSNFLSSSKTIMHFVGILITIILLSLAILLVKIFTNDLYVIIIVFILVAILKFVLSSRLDLYSNWTRNIFMKKAEKSNYHQTFKDDNRTYLDKAKAYVKGDIKIWK